MIEPRKWQAKAIDRIVSAAQNGADRALVAACPASGKTYAGLMIAKALYQRAMTTTRKIVIITPSIEIKTQWIKRGRDLDLELLEVSDTNILLDRMDDLFSGGIVLTYQQAINNQEGLRRFCDVHKPIVILDEVHHTAGSTERTRGNIWGEKIVYSLANCPFKLAMTGTPFRRGANPIVYVNYDQDGRVIADFEYQYIDAIRDGVCRPIEFSAFDHAAIKWTDHSGTEVVAGFSTPLTKAKDRERIRAAVKSNFAIEMLTQANDTLNKIRENSADRDAGGLVVVIDHKHADAVADDLEKICGTKPVVVYDTIDDSPERIKAFREGSDPWIIGIQMLSEGVDIPRLRVGVYCTNIRAPLYFHQFCGRVTRVTEGKTLAEKKRERSHVFLPEDSELMAVALEIQETVAYALGEEVVPIQRVGRSSPKTRREIEPGDNVSEHTKSVYGGFSSDRDYLKIHSAIIQQCMEVSPGCSAVEMAAILQKAGTIPLHEGSLNDAITKERNVQNRPKTQRSGRGAGTDQAGSAGKSPSINRRRGKRLDVPESSDRSNRERDMGAPETDGLRHGAPDGAGSVRDNPIPTRNGNHRRDRQETDRREQAG